MKRIVIKDERIITTSQKYTSHGFMIVFGFLMVSLFVKVFVLHWDMKYWLDLLLIVMAAGLYVTVRSIKEGLYLLPSKTGDINRLKKGNLIGGAVATLIWAALMFISDVGESGKIDLAKCIMTTLLGAIVFFFGTTWLQWLMIKQSNKNADKKLE